MGKSRGNLIAEYGLIMALVALAAITSLAYLGGVLDQSYAKNGDFSQANELFGLLGGSPPGGGNGGGTDGAGPASAVSALPPEAMQAYANAGITGSFEVPIGSANMASSAEGIEKLARMLGVMADTGTLPDGTQMDTDDPRWQIVSGFLNELSAEGTNISTEEFIALKRDGTEEGPASNLSTIQLSMGNYAHVHERLEGYVADNYTPAETQKLMGFVNQASGVISNGADNFVRIGMETFDFGEGAFSINPDDNYGRAMRTVGNAYTPGSIVEIPVKTEVSADELRHAAGAERATDIPAGIQEGTGAN